MCLAIPPNKSRSPPYTLPFSLPASELESSPSAAEASCGQTNMPGGARASSAMISNGYPYYSSSSYALPPGGTPPPANNSGLGQIGFSPVLSSNYGGIKQQQQVNDGSYDSATTSVSAVAVSSSSSPIAPSSSRRPKATTSASATAASKRRRRGPQRPGKTATDKERLFVQHNYHDLSSEPDALPKNNGCETSIISINNKKTPGPSSSPLLSESFPMKLHRILEETEAAGQAHIISWQPHGRAFKIRNPTLFTAQVMPLYFPKMKKLTSLQRQFNLYGFERLTREGPDAGAYYHEAFLRHRPGMSAQRMFRRRVKGTGYKAASNPEAEPDLYSLPSMEEMVTRKRMANMSDQEDSAVASARQQQPSVQAMSCALLQAPVQAVQPVQVMSSSCFHPVNNAYASSNLSYADCNLSNQDAQSMSGVVTESSRSSYTTSYSSSEESGSHQDRRPYQQLYQQHQQQQYPVSSMSVRHLPSNAFMFQQDSLNAIAAGRHCHQGQASSVDTFLQDFFSGNDITPISPVTSSINAMAATAAVASATATINAANGQQQRQQDHPILQEFADLWENASFHLK